jgi:small subunit ribosomal protein S8
MLNDPLAAALAKISNAERVGKKEVVISPVSKIIKKILVLMNEHGYLGSFEEEVYDSGIVLKVNLIGNINKCNVIKPRFSTKVNNFVKWEKRYLPAQDFGIILVSTPNGIMTHNDAKKQSVGGKLLAYCY